MPAVARPTLLLLVIVAYGVSYAYLDRTMQGQSVKLQSAPPLKVLQTMSGYFEQISSEMIFIQTSVFLGGLKKLGTVVEDYDTELAHNFRTMTSLYPDFIDPYYLTNAFLAPASRYGAEQADLVFDTGITAYPKDFVLRFFKGANLFYNLQQPLQAADAFAKAAKIEDAPPMFAHLAAIFSGRSGELKAGLIMLQTMANAEKNELVKERYNEEIECFKQAIAVQNAIDLYTKEHGIPPKFLQQLVPKYINAIPTIEKRFVLVYKPPKVSLERPVLPPTRKPAKSTTIENP